MAITRLGFLRSSGDIDSGIFVPKFYDPSIGAALDALRASHDLVSIGRLMQTREISVHYGHDIGKHYYGHGTIPYVRTSDLAAWEVVSAPKQVVGLDAYDVYGPRQDIRANDVLFVRDGQYLIGHVALVTPHDLPFIHQSHMIRLRVAPDARVSPSLLLGMLSTPIVARQVRSKQFTAGIIDKIEDRYEDILLPIPRGARAQELGAEIAALVERRVYLRERLKRIPMLAQGLIADIEEPYVPEAAEVRPETLGYRLPSAEIENNILIPKYYDPKLTDDLRAKAGQFELRSVRSLVADDVLEVSTGLEVGKMAYGLGEVPFIRTSDLADWELAGVAKQRVSAGLYETLRARADVQPGDVLLVRDGTYLVGTSAILTGSDAKALYAGGIYKLRVKRPEVLDPYLLIALLNMPIVKAQIRARQFTRDIIDTLGLRLYDVVVPLPKGDSAKRRVASIAREVVEERAQLRERAKAIVLEIEGGSVDVPEEREAAQELTL